LGKSGTRAGPPTVFPWRWYYHLASVAFWALVILPLVLIKENRRFQAWAILIPLLVIVVVCQMLANLIANPSAEAEGFHTFVVTLATAWAMVWLVGFWVASRHRSLMLPVAVLVMLAVGLLSYLCDGRALNFENVGPSAYYIVSVLALLLPLLLSSRSCRKVYSPQRFMLWLWLWMPLTLAGVLVLGAGGLFLFMDVTTGLLGLAHILIMMPFAALMGGLCGVLLYLLNLPFMLMAFRSPFYHQRFCKVFGLQAAADAAGEQGTILKESRGME
jgi:hypothetical protein